jgi:hypothetical protein
VASGGGSHLGVGGEMAMGKEASDRFFLFIGGGEREGVVLVLHVSDSWPTARRSDRTTARRQVPCSVPLAGGPQSGF